VLHLVGDWFPVDVEREERVMGIVGRVRERGADAYELARVAEQALYEIHSTERSLPQRRQLVLDVIARGDIYLRDPLLYGLAQEPGGPVFEALRGEALEAMQRANVPDAVFATYLARLAHPSNVELPIGLVEQAVSHLPAPRRTEVVLDAVASDSTDRLAALIGTAPLEALEEPTLRAFVDAFAATGDKFEALRSVRSA